MLLFSSLFYFCFILSFVSCCQLLLNSMLGVVLSEIVHVLQQTVDGIPVGTICASLYADLFFYSHVAEFTHGLLKKIEKKPLRSFNFIFRYMPIFDFQYF